MTNENPNLFIPTRSLAPVVGSYIGPIGVVFVGVNTYECTDEIKAFLKLSSDAPAAANIIQSAKLELQFNLVAEFDFTHLLDLDGDSRYRAEPRNYWMLFRQSSIAARIRRRCLSFAQSCET